MKQVDHDIIDEQLQHDHGNEIVGTRGYIATEILLGNKYVTV